MKKGLHMIDFVTENGERGIRIFFVGKNTGVPITQFFTFKEILNCLKGGKIKNGTN